MSVGDVFVLVVCIVVVTGCYVWLFREAKNGRWFK